MAQNAAVDTMGCERLGLDTVSPKVKSTSEVMLVDLNKRLVHSEHQELTSGF